MLKYSLIFLFLMQAAPGCGFFDRCEEGNFCVRNELWTCYGPGEISGCDDEMREDCGDSGKVCRQFVFGDDRSKSAGCFVPDVDRCEPDQRSRCDGDVVYQCNTLAQMVEEVDEDCAGSDRICQEYLWHDEPMASCFYSDQECDPEVKLYCDDNAMYACHPVVGLAYDRASCDDGTVCTEGESFGAVCSGACDEGSAPDCNNDESFSIECVDGLWIPLELCDNKQVCTMVTVDGIAHPRCTEPDTETESP